MRKRREPTDALHVRIPQSTRDRLDILLYDPFHKRIQYGALTKIITAALEEYCDRHLSTDADIKAILEEVRSSTPGSTPSSTTASATEGETP